MKKPTLGFAALIIATGAAVAVAQDEPGDRIPGSQQGVERGPSSDGGREGRSGPAAGALRGESGAERDGVGASERGRRAEGPNPAARTDPPEGKMSGAKREDDTSGRDGDRKLRKQSSDEGKGAKREKRDASEARRGEDKSSDDAPARKDAKAKPDTERGDRRQSKAERDGDGDRAAKSDAPDRASGRNKDDDGARQADRGRDDADGDRMAVDHARKADLSGDKRDRVGQALRRDRDVKHRTDVDIDIAVGTRLPRDWDYAPVPTAVIEVVPEYRGYVIAYVEDEYVITDPETYEVVAVLPAEGGGGPRYAGSGGGDARCSETLTLTDRELDDILRSIQMSDEVDVSDITVGWSVPSEIELKTFPEPIVERSGKLSACRYFIADDQIAIVDPEEETVVLLIEHDHD